MHGTLEPGEKEVERCNTEEPEARKIERADTAKAGEVAGLAGSMKLEEALGEISQVLESRMTEAVVEDCFLLASGRLARRILSDIVLFAQQTWLRLPS